MQRHRNRLLITLVLTALYLGCIWASAEARRVTVDGRATLASAYEKPGAQRLSGEPDGNHVDPDAPRTTSGRIQGDPEFLAPVSASDLVRWIGKIWMARTLGVKL